MTRSPQDHGVLHGLWFSMLFMVFFVVAGVVVLVVLTGLVALVAWVVHAAIQVMGLAL